MNKISVKDIKETKQVNGLSTNSLSFTVTGVNHVFTNTIVRILLTYCGAFAFNPEHMQFDINTTIWNRDRLKLRISNIPITTPIKHKQYATKCLEAEEKNLSMADKTDIEILADKEREKIERVNNLHMYISARNDTKDIIDVTSNSKQTTFYMNGEVIPDPYEREIQLVQLQPGQEIKMSAVSEFNIPSHNNIYASVQKAYHREVGDNEYRLFIHSYRQIYEKILVKEACNIIKLKITKIVDYIISKINDSEHAAQIEIPNESQTMGELLTYYVQHHKGIHYCGYNKEHPDDSSIFLEYKTNGMAFSKILSDVKKNIHDDYDVVINKL
jgi:DNA-directed RNA polymerase subunit L